VLFFPYIPTYLYAIHLGYPTQTYLGGMLAKHTLDLGFHLLPFLRDVRENTGVFPFYALLLAPVALWRCFSDRRYQWLLAWIGLAALPFLVAVTSKVTQAAGYHEHLTGALTVLLGLTLASLKPKWLGIPLGVLVATGALLVTLGGIFRVVPLVPLWPSSQIPYGGLVPNSGMKTAGYWVRQNLRPQERVFVAHDPAVSYWYLGREAVTGGYTGQMERAGSFLKTKNQVSAAVIPDQRDMYPASLFQSHGFPGHITVRSEGREVLDLYTRTPGQQTLSTEQIDPLYDKTYRTAAAIIPPGAPYAPGKAIGSHGWEKNK
jgi:hypothetical protein